MTVPIEHDRIAQLLIASDDGLDIDAARLQLERAAISLTWDPAAAATAWGQAALVTIARCGTRMFRGGVFLRSSSDVEVRVGVQVGANLKRALIDCGCREIGMPSSPFRIHVGATPVDTADLYCMADGWRGIVAPDPITPGIDANVIGGAVAGAMAVTEAFRRHVLGDLLAARRVQSLSAWDPSNPLVGGPIDRLPQKLWLLGGGNLGQASLFILGLLPFVDRGAVSLLVHDADTSGVENLNTQILTEHGWVGRKKARCLADYAEAMGFNVNLSERRFTNATRPSRDEPRIALVGVDNLPTRRFAAKAGFDLVLDAGLGSSAAEIFDIRLHSFPGIRAVEDAWPTKLDQLSETPELNGGLRKLVEQGRLDACGAVTIAGQSLGVPSTAVVAAAIQVAQVCRALSTGRYCDYVDLRLSDASDVSSHTASFEGNLASLASRA